MSERTQLQRTCACRGQCADCKKKESTVQRLAVGEAQSSTAPPIVHEVLRSPGRPLEAATRAFFEPRFGHNFSGVRVHNDSRSAASAQAVNALAYTVGQNVVFAGGRYNPQRPEGRELLAHELTHVVQQKGAPESANQRMGSANDPAEREACRGFRSDEFRTSNGIPPGAGVGAEFPMITPCPNRGGSQS